MTTRTVLICGCSIAGPTLAYWLARHGFQPTLLERALAPRPGGQAVDVRGVALEVLRGMGLLEAARNLRTQMKGASILDADGKEVWRSDKMTFTGGVFARHDIEILRDDLARILLDKARTDSELIYGDCVTALREDDHGIEVTFEKNPPRRFDLVIGADGLHSNVRSMVFGDEKQFLIPLDYLLAVYSVPNYLGLQDWQIAYRNGGEGCLVYTARNNTELRVGFGLVTNLADEHPGNISAQKQLLAQRFSHFEWEIPRLLEAMWTAPDFYLGAVAQIRMTHYTKGRVALVGDAGYCPSLFSGQGSSLAIVGAYVLAHELARSPHSHATAFASYEARMRGYIEMNQMIAHLARTEEIISEHAAESKVLKALDAAKNGIVLEGLS